MTGKDRMPPAAGLRGRAAARLRIGVLGTGYWAWWCHGTVLARRPDVDFAGFWGRDAAKAADAAARAGAGRGFTDLDELLDSVDAVAIALPPDLQARLAVRAARAGRHVLLEKPLALDLAAADEVVAAVADAGVVSLSFLTYLFQPEVTAWLHRMRELAEARGPWEGVSVNCAGNIDAPGSPYAGSVWRRERGGLWDWGPHALSLVSALLPPIEHVTTTLGMRDTVLVGLEHAGGAVSSLTLTLTAPEQAADCTVAAWGPAGRRALQLPAGGLREAYHRAVDQFLEAIAGGELSPPLDATRARGIVAVLDAAQRQSARPVEQRATAPAP